METCLNPLGLRFCLNLLELVIYLNSLELGFCLKLRLILVFRFVFPLIYEANHGRSMGVPEGRKNPRQPP